MTGDDDEFDLDDEELGFDDGDINDPSNFWYEYDHQIIEHPRSRSSEG